MELYTSPPWMPEGLARHPHCRQENHGKAANIAELSVESCASSKLEQAPGQPEDGEKLGERLKRSVRRLELMQSRGQPSVE